MSKFTKQVRTQQQQLLQQVRLPIELCPIRPLSVHRSPRDVYVGDTVKRISTLANAAGRGTIMSSGTDFESNPNIHPQFNKIKTPLLFLSLYTVRKLLAGLESHI